MHIFVCSVCMCMCVCVCVLCALHDVCVWCHVCVWCARTSLCVCVCACAPVCVCVLRALQDVCVCLASGLGRWALSVRSDIPEHHCEERATKTQSKSYLDGLASY